MAFYGRSFTLANPSETNPGSSHQGAGAPGPYTREASFLGYNEICENDWTTKWDSTHEVPYAFKDTQWVGYDNEESIEKKIEFLKSKNLGGAMIWSIETDDFLGNCFGRYPLLRKVNSALSRYVPNDQKIPNYVKEDKTNKPAKQPNKTTQKPAGSMKSTSTFKCPGDGLFSHPEDCTRFYSCFDNNIAVFDCPSPLQFDEKISSCNYPEVTQCKS